MLVVQLEQSHCYALQPFGFVGFQSPHSRDAVALLPCAAFSS